jgi:MFS family permease
MYQAEKPSNMVHLEEHDVAEVERKGGGDLVENNAAVSDPHDPLTWSLSRKLTILLVVGIWILLGTSNMIIIGPALQTIPLEFNSSFNTSTYLVGGPLLAYGISSFLWVPLGNRYGVRLTFVVAALCAGCMDCWAAKATSFGNLVAARTLASFFYAPPETLAPQLVGDVFPLKDRAKAMTWIGILQASGFSGGPLVGAFIIQDRYAY